MLLAASSSWDLPPVRRLPARPSSELPDELLIRETRASWNSWVFLVYRLTAMQRREVTLHAFSSIKGGVGKSTLAVVAANLLARRGRRCLVVDVDLIGTSL